MSFVNEIVSEQDIQNYQLDDLKKKFNEWTWRNGRPEGFIHDWTVDRATNIYLVNVKMIEEVGPSGRPEPTSKRIFVLNIDSECIQFILDRVHCSSSASDSPFYVEWDLLEMKPEGSAYLKKEDAIKILKEALSVYGYRGAHRSVPNTIVKLRF